MKRILSVAGILASAFLFLTAFSIRENPQDPPRGEKGKKHIMLEKFDDKGNKTSLDTFIAGDDFFVWNGDTVGGKGDLKWITKDRFNLDSIHETPGMNFEYEIKDNGDGNVVVLKSGEGGKHIIREFLTDGDSTKKFLVHIDKDDFMSGDHDMMFWNDKEGNKAFFGPELPHLPDVPDVPHVMFRGKMNRANVIDLSDPGIISYKKKKNKDGTEKITIVRKQVNEDEAENIDEIIMAPKYRSKDVILKGPEQVKKIKIIKDDGKKKEIEIEENKENN